MADMERDLDDLIQDYSDHIQGILGGLAYSSAMTAFSEMPRQRARAVDFAEKYMESLEKKTKFKRTRGSAGWLVDNSKEVRKMIVAAVRANKHPDELAAEIATIGLGDAQTIARTELATIQNAVRVERMIDQGFEKLVYIAVPDERMCPDCGAYHLAVFNAGEEPVLPMHPNCRCTYVPYDQIAKVKA